MEKTFKKRMEILKSKLDFNNVDLAIITDEDSIYYFTGYYDYLHMDFGRPTILLVSNKSGSHLITPEMERHMANISANVEKLSFWNDGNDDEWRTHLPSALNKNSSIAFEKNLMPPLIQNYIKEYLINRDIVDISPIISDIRMIKSEEELNLARHAGQVAIAMMDAGKEAISEGVEEYEVALATSAAGTRVAAQLLKKYYKDMNMSPNTHFLQIMSSGENISMPHHRASTKKMKFGDPVFLCFCGMTNFNRFKLGFDRTFWIGEINNSNHKKIYELAIQSQSKALSLLKPGVVAEDIHTAYAKVISEAGFDYPFRCGRATGYSYLEKPEIVYGDKTIIKPGMVLAIDGSITLDSTFRVQVGDSFIVTDDGYECLTPYPNTLNEIIIKG